MSLKNNHLSYTHRKKNHSFRVIKNSRKNFGSDPTEYSCIVESQINQPNPAHNCYQKEKPYLKKFSIFFWNFFMLRRFYCNLINYMICVAVKLRRFRTKWFVPSNCTFSKIFYQLQEKKIILRTLLVYFIIEINPEGPKLGIFKKFSHFWTTKFFDFLKESLWLRNFWPFLWRWRWWPCLSNECQSSL